MFSKFLFVIILCEYAILNHFIKKHDVSLQLFNNPFFFLNGKVGACAHQLYFSVFHFIVLMQILNRSDIYAKVKQDSLSHSSHCKTYWNFSLNCFTI